MSEDVHTLVGAWVLDALDEDERIRVERHFTECDSCAQEAAELRETVARLADTTVTEPPAHLRDSVLAEARRTRQEVPVASQGAAPASSPIAARRRGPHRGRRSPRLRLALGAAALALAAAFAGVFATWSIMSGPDTTDHERQMAAVLEASDAEIVSKEAVGGGRVTVVFSASMDGAVVFVSGLASPGEDRAYQIWMVDGAGKSSVGVMEAGDSSSMMLVEGLGDTEMIAVTIEPAGGSDTPTMPMVADVLLIA